MQGGKESLQGRFSHQRNLEQEPPSGLGPQILSSVLNPSVQAERKGRVLLGMWLAWTAEARSGGRPGWQGLLRSEGKGFIIEPIRKHLGSANDLECDSAAGCSSPRRPRECELLQAATPASCFL